MGVLLAVLVAVLPLWWPGTADKSRKAAVGPLPVAPLRDAAAAMAEALRTGKETLVETATSATSLTWALPSGQLRSTIHATPQRMQDARGRWTPIDNTLTRTGNNADGLDIRPVNTPTPLRFSGGTSGRTDGTSVLAEMDIDGHTIAYTWPGPLPEPVLDGSRALYPEALPGTDLLVVAREDGGFGQLLIVKNRAAATIQAVSAPTYGLRSDTAVFRHDATTDGVLVVDPGSGQEIGSIPTPYAWDSAGQDPEAPEAAPRTSVATAADVLWLSGLHGIEPGARQARMPTRLDGDGTGDARLHLDAAATGLLTDEKSVFPVFLDPPLISGKQAWTTVYKQHPNTNTWNGTNFNSGSTDARVGYEKNTPLTARSFWRMGYSASLKGATVSSASFKVLNNHSWNCDAREMQLWLTGAISSGTTWNKQPSWITLQQKQSFAHGYGTSCADDYVSFDVKNAAQQGANQGLSNLTFGMYASNESDTVTWRKFKVTSAELNVVYNRPPTEPTSVDSVPGGACVAGPGNGVTVAKTNIVLSATATDPDGNLNGLRFRFWKTGTTAPAGTLITSLISGRGSLTIPSTTLEDKTTYSWDVRAEDSSNASALYPPSGSESCRITIDASAPSAPVVESDVFKEATNDGATWATVKFGETGPIAFTSEDATQFSYSLDGVGITYVPATAGTATVPDLRPRHAGPNTLEVYAYDAAGNRSALKTYTFYVPPRDVADGPGDTGGDGVPDLTVIDPSGNLRTFAGDVDGDLYSGLFASYITGNRLNPPGHWYDPASGKAALITKHSDVYPGDGTTDLFARTPDGGFWLYPGDGYGSFNVDHRLRILLPSNVPDPTTWTQIKAVGDITGDTRPDLLLRVGTQFWTLTGYTGASFQEAILMEGTSWARQEVLNVADIDLDGTPDLLWRNLDSGGMYVRHGKPGSTAGSVDLNSLKSAATSRNGDVSYGTDWTEAKVNAIVSIPDVNGDRVPDLWARSGEDGRVRVYYPSATNVGAPVKVVLSTDLTAVKAFG
ncbi:VCBS repeat-containing protein [Micromonospora sonneratiae]